MLSVLETGLVESKLFDGARVPYPDNSFDLAYMSHVVEHLEHPRQLIYEAARVANQEDVFFRGMAIMFPSLGLSRSIREPVLEWIFLNV